MIRGRALATWMGMFTCLIACGDDPGPLCEAGSFCEANMAQLEYDCKQSVMCRAQRGDQLESDPVNGCVKATAKLLENDGEKQRQFLANYNNCALQIVCAYYDCALADVASYGDIQLPKIEHDCQQQIQCMVDLGQAPLPTALDSCIASSIAAVSNLPVDRRPAFEGAWDNCNRMGYTSCAWRDCFMF